MLAEDEINCAFNVALSIDLVSSLSKECILVTIESNAVVSLLGVVSRECNGLRSLAVGVLDVDVVEFRISS